MAHLELDNITVRFGGLVALSQLSFAINSGEIVGLIGPNGAGENDRFQRAHRCLQSKQRQCALRG